MLNQKVQESLNDQINYELSSAYNYLGMAAYCELQNFLGCAAWLKAQSEEEYTHGMKLYRFLLARNCKVVLKPIPEAKCDFKNVVEVFEQALAQERDVTGRIEALYELAFKEKAFAELVELQWFITEQVEEERTARDIAAKFNMVKSDSAALLDLDRELGSRKSRAAEPAAAAAN